jgi:hypothetical protein
MEQFPKIARSRMAGQVTGAHPEAELLNAFTENALAPKERETVLTHLAACANCREMVSLAAEARPDDAPIVKPARSGFRWATFQWAAVAASVAIVTVAVLVVGPKEPRTPQLVTSSPVVHQQPTEAHPAPKVAETANMDLKASRLPRSKADLEAESRKAEKKVVTGGGTGLAPADGVSIIDGGFGGIGVYSRNAGQKTTRTDAVAKLQDKKEAGTTQPTQAAPLRDHTYTAPALGANDSFYSSTPVNRRAQGSVQGGIVQNAPLPTPAVDGERAQAEEQGKASNEISKDKRRVAASQPSTESVEVSSQAAAIAPTPAVPAAIKTKSSDADVDVLSRFNAPTPRMWRLHAGKVESSDDSGQVWQEKSPANSGPLTKVAAAGQEIFAGGKAGAFFISRDNGQTWTRVSLTGDDVIPLSDVTDIRPTSPQMVDVILNTGDDWQSNDGGRSFRLLPRKP